MKEIAQETQVCINRYSTAMKSVPVHLHEQPASMSTEDEEEKLLSPALVYEENYRKRKRETADEGIKGVCW